MDGKEVRGLKVEEIKSELARLRAKLFTLRAQSVTEKVEDNSQFRKIRRDVARLLTERKARVAGTPGRDESRVAAPAGSRKAP